MKSCGMCGEPLDGGDLRTHAVLFDDDTGEYLGCLSFPRDNGIGANHPSRVRAFHAHVDHDAQIVAIDGYRRFFKRAASLESVRPQETE